MSAAAGSVGCIFEAGARDGGAPDSMGAAETHETNRGDKTGGRMTAATSTPALMTDIQSGGLRGREPMPTTTSRETPPDHHSMNGDLIRSLPVWARVLALIGIPGAIAVFLVWQGASELPRLTRQQAELAAEIARLQERVQLLQVNIATNRRMLQRICVNTGKTEEERERCFD